MTGQVLAAALLALAVVAALPPLLLRDLRAARRRRNPWHGWKDLGFTTDDRLPPDSVFLVSPMRCKPPTITVGYDPGLSDRVALALEFRYSMTVLRPEACVKIVDVTP